MSIPKSILQYLLYNLPSQSNFRGVHSLWQIGAVKYYNSSYGDSWGDNSSYGDSWCDNSSDGDSFGDAKESRSISLDRGHGCKQSVICYTFIINMSN